MFLTRQAVFWLCQQVGPGCVAILVRSLGSGWQLNRDVEDSATGTRTRVARVRAEYPNQLDYSGSCFMTTADDIEKAYKPDTR